MEEVTGSIYGSLFDLGSEELFNLLQCLASESKTQLERIWGIAESPVEGEKLIRYLHSLSTEQKRMLVGRVTLRLLRNFSAFLDDNGVHRFSQEKPPSLPRNSIGNNNKFARNWYLKTSEKCRGNDAASDLDYSVWRDTDAALVLLLISEAHDQECLQVVNKWQVDPSLFTNLFKPDKIFGTTTLCLEWMKSYVCENILKMAYNVPLLMVDVSVQTACLRSYVDLVQRYLRLLRAFMSDLEDENLKENPCPPASAATILCLPSIVYTRSRCGGRLNTVCSICGNDLEDGSLASCLPCSHIYHWECINPWLKTRNTCPVCRHELPTDDVFYEIERHMKCFVRRALY